MFDLNVLSLTHGLLLLNHREKHTSVDQNRQRQLQKQMATKISTVGFRWKHPVFMLDKAVSIPYRKQKDKRRHGISDYPFVYIP